MMRPLLPPPAMPHTGNFSSCGLQPRECLFTERFFAGALPALVVIIVFGIVANALVLYIIAANKAMRTVPNCYAANICVTDMVFLSVASVSDVVEYAYGATGTLNKTVLPRAVNVYFHLVLTNAICAMLCALAFDRYLAIVHPFKFKRYRTVKFAFFIGVVAWIVSFAVCTPIYSGEFSDAIYDKFAYEDFFLAIVVSCVFSYILPLLVIACCYAAILHTIWCKTTLFGAASTGTNARVLKRNLAVLKSVLVIAVVFALNFGVLYVVYLWLSLCAPTNFIKVFTAAHVASIMGCIGICLNPLIYGLMQPNFQPYLREMLDIFRVNCVRCCERKGREIPSISAAAAGTKETSLTESRKDQDI